MMSRTFICGWLLARVCTNKIVIRLQNIDDARANGYPFGIEHITDMNLSTSSATTSDASEFELLFGRVRAQILQAMYTEPSRRLHLRGLAREANIATRSVEVEAARLVRADVLTEEREANLRFFKANAEAPMFKVLCDLARNAPASSPAAIVRQAFAEVAGIERLLIFGSEARGTARADSDIDVLVIGDCDSRDVLTASFNATLKIGREVTALPYTAKQWRELLREKNDFALGVEKGAKILLRGEKTWH